MINVFKITEFEKTTIRFERFTKQSSGKAGSIGEIKI